MTTTNKGLNQPAFDSLNWDAPINQNAEWIDTALGGSASISVTGVSSTPVTLTVDQYRPKSLVFTGTLTANVTYRLPVGIGGDWVIVNSTTGSFTLTISSAAGGPSAVIPQGSTSAVFSNGTSAVGVVILNGITPAIQAALDSKQPIDPTLTALSGYNTNGILTQTAADTFTGRAITGTANQISVTNGNGVSGNPTISAVVASQAEAEAGTNTTKLMTAQRTRQALNASGAAPTYACRAWVNFNGSGAATIRESGNVSGITYNGPGDYTINFATSMPDANYSVVGTAQISSFAGTGQFGYSVSIANQAPTVSAVRIKTSSAAAGDYDASIVNVAIFR